LRRFLFSQERSVPTALLIFVATLIAVVWQPHGLGIGWSASAGALAALPVRLTQERS